MTGCVRAYYPLSFMNTRRGDGLVLRNRVDFCGRRRLGVKDIAQPFLGETTGELNTYDALAHAKNLSIVTQHTPFHRKAVVSRDRTDTRYFVGGNGDTYMSC